MLVLVMRLVLSLKKADPESGVEWRVNHFTMRTEPLSALHLWSPSFELRSRTRWYISSSGMVTVFDSASLLNEPLFLIPR